MSDLIQVKEQNGLFIHKYKRKVFYDNLWHTDHKLLDARGLVTDSDNNIIQYPFTKIFNYGENNTTIDPDHLVLAVDKINGFMAAVTWYNDDVLVSTTGSLTSEYVDMAKELLPLDEMSDVLRVNSDITFLFEIVHPDDPHIINEELGVYLIGARKKEYGSKQISQKALDAFACLFGNVYRPFYYSAYFFEVLSDVKDYNREGFVVYDLESDAVLKLKSPYYLTTKFIARTKKLDKIFGNNYKQHFDEEFYPLCEYLRDKYSLDEFTEMKEWHRLEIVRNWTKNSLTQK